MADNAVEERRHVWGIVAALRFLLPLGRDRGELCETVAARAVRWIVPIGLLTGLLWAGLFRLTWRMYGEIGNLRVIPALSVVLLESLVTGPFRILGLARTVDVLRGSRPMTTEAAPETPLSPLGTMILFLVLLSEWVLIVSIPHRAGWWPSEGDWRHSFSFLYPLPLFRPLVLAPLWGRWGILLTAAIGKSARCADPDVAAIGRVMGARRLLTHALLPMILTGVFFSRDHNRLIGVVMGMLVFGITYMASVVMARRGGGQSRRSVFAGGQIAQLSFLAIYRAFWPLIHG